MRRTGRGIVSGRGCVQEVAVQRVGGFDSAGIFS